jgi:hypothetical protein
MTLAVLANSRTVAEPTFPIAGGYRITAAKLQKYLELKARKRERLIASEKSRLRATRLLDEDYDRITGWLAQWTERWLREAIR